MKRPAASAVPGGPERTRSPEEPGRYTLRFAALALCLFTLAGALDPLMAQVANPNRGLGPFKAVIQGRGETQVRLLRRDRSMVWILQQSQGGSFIETGIEAAKFQSLDVPTPALFGQVDRVADAAAAAALLPEMKKLADQLKPFRDLPGMISDQALARVAQLYEKQENWPAAMELYNEILAQPYTNSGVTEARQKAGLCLVRMKEYEKALQLLDIEALGSEDPSVLSEVYMARALAFEASGNLDQALMSYLHLVVFFPFVENNEEKCLAAALPLYEKLGDWDGAWKTVEALSRLYPGTPGAEAAAAFAARNQEAFRKEADFHESSTNVLQEHSETFIEDKGVADEFK